MFAAVMSAGATSVDEMVGPAIEAAAWFLEVLHGVEPTDAFALALEGVARAAMEANDQHP